MQRRIDNENIAQKLTSQIAVDFNSCVYVFTGIKINDGCSIILVKKSCAEACWKDCTRIHPNRFFRNGGMSVKVKTTESKKNERMLKLLAVIFAVMLWFYVDAEQNPVKSVHFDTPLLWSH